MFSICVVIPVYNHEHAIGHVVAEVKRQGYPCILVNDGSSDACRAVLESLVAGDDVVLVNLPQNGGKGAAVSAGLREALRRGYSHAIQIDADGQHDLQDLARFAATAQEFPDHLISGYPRYDDSIPKSRLYGRYLTHVWVWINTLSLQIKDSMCGFRAYPLARIVPLLDAHHLGQRMDFDPEILVQAHWQGIPMRWLETRVTYPLDGVSHFDAWRDNVLISKMHAKLFFLMLLQSPRILAKRLSSRSSSSGRSSA